MASIQFSNGLTIVPNSAGVGAGVYNLLIGGDGFNPATQPGTITFPNQSTLLGESDPNLIIEDASLYINFVDANSEDNSSILESLTTNSGTIRLSQGNYHIEFGFTPGVFAIVNMGIDIGVYSDPYINVGATGTLSLVSTSGTTFNDVDPIIVTISI
jgi:hypothetical protein